MRAPPSSSKASLLRRVCAVLQSRVGCDGLVYEDERACSIDEEGAARVKWDSPVCGSCHEGEEGVGVTAQRPTNAAQTRHSLLAASAALERLMSYAAQPEEQPACAKRI